MERYVNYVNTPGSEKKKKLHMMSSHNRLCFGPLCQGQTSVAEIEM